MVLQCIIPPVKIIVIQKKPKMFQILLLCLVCSLGVAKGQSLLAPQAAAGDTTTSYQLCNSTGPTCLQALCAGVLVDGYYQYCGNCSTFLQCVNESTSYLQCPPYHHWDDSLRHCVLNTNTCVECHIPGEPTPTLPPPTQQTTWFDELCK